MVHDDMEGYQWRQIQWAVEVLLPMNGRHCRQLQWIIIV